MACVVMVCVVMACIVADVVMAQRDPQLVNRRVSIQTCVWLVMAFTVMAYVAMARGNPGPLNGHVSI